MSGMSTQAGLFCGDSEKAKDKANLRNRTRGSKPAAFSGRSNIIICSAGGGSYVKAILPT